MRTHLNTADPHRPTSLTKNPPPRDRRTTSRPTERPDVHVRRKPRSHPTWSCAANTRNPPRSHLSTPRLAHIFPHHTTNPTWSISCHQTLTLHTDRRYCGTDLRMRTPRTITTPGAVSRAIRSLHFSLRPNYPPSPKSWVEQWNPNMDDDSKRLWSSPPPGQPQTWDKPLTSLPAQSTRTHSKASTPPPPSPC
jgi:hypothetical protein